MRMRDVEDEAFVKAEVEAARARLADEPEDASRLEALVTSLGRLADLELERGMLKDALRAAEEGVALERRRMAPDPERVLGLSESLERVGDVYMERGELERALALYEE